MIFYVDPQSGLDSNNGTSESTPWKTLPGTRTASNSGFLVAAWGSITTSNKISAGDIINLKAGSTHSSTQGGRPLINSSYYNNGTSGNPIKIQVSSTWGSGDFTYNLNGMSTTDQYWGIFVVQARDYIQVLGNSSTKRILFINQSGTSHCGVHILGTSVTHMQGFTGAYWDISNCSGSAGANFSFVDNSTISNSNSHNNSTCGWLIGDLNDDVCIGLTFSSCKGYSNGVGDSANQTHGFQSTGARQLRYVNCEAYSNGRDGFDGGLAHNDGTVGTQIKHINSYSHDNGEDGFGVNSGTVANITFYEFYNCIAANNGSNFQIYDGPVAKLYNCMIIGSGRGIYTYRSDSSYAIPNITIKNCYFRCSGAHFDCYPGGSNTPSVITSSNNIYAPVSSNGATFVANWPTGGNPTNANYTFNNKPSFITASDKVGIDYAQTLVGGTDYHPSGGAGPINNAGVYISGDADWTSDKDGNLRSNPPEIGPYEFDSPTLRLNPPTNFRIVP